MKENTKNRCDDLTKINLPTILHTESSLGWGGQEIRIMTELLELKKMGFRMVLIAHKDGEIYKRALKAGLEAYGITFKNKADILSWFMLLKLIKKIKPHILNTHSSDDSWMAGLIGRILNVKLIIRTRHVSTPITSSFSYKALADIIVTTSDFTMSHLVASGVESKKISVIPTGIYAERFRFKGENRIAVRNDLKLGANEILVGNICVLRSWKGLDFFIDVAAALPENFKFILVGDGPQRERLVKDVRAKGLEGKVTFLGHREDVERYFSGLDIFLFTSYANEGIPQSLLQARASGVFIVATSTKPVLEGLRDYKYYSLIDYGDVQKAAKTIINTIQEGRLPSEDERKESNKWINENYGVKKMVSSLIALYLQSGIYIPNSILANSVM